MQVSLTLLTYFQYNLPSQIYIKQKHNCKFVKYLRIAIEIYFKFCLEDFCLFAIYAQSLQLAMPVFCALM